MHSYLNYCVLLCDGSFMDNQFTLEGKTYRVHDLADKSALIYQRLVFTYRSIENLNAQHSLMTGAKNAYIEDLKSEIIEQKSGVDIGALFSED